MCETMKRQAIINSIYGALQHLVRNKELLKDAITAHFDNTEPPDPTKYIEDGPKRIVVCAANIHGGVIVLGPRHFDKTMHDQISQLDDGLAPTCSSFWEQGFIDQFGKFMDREEAYQVALKAGQINLHRPKSGGIGNTLLYSEDLY
jgi:hypothetical protein